MVKHRPLQFCLSKHPVWAEGDGSAHAFGDQKFKGGCGPVEWAGVVVRTRGTRYGRQEPPRKKIPRNIETAVLAQSARRCTLCFCLNGDLSEKIGQIAHLDEDRTNDSEDNLAWMCRVHHSLYDSKTSQHKNYTIDEVKAARAKLYALVGAGMHLSPAAAQPYLRAEADKKVLQDSMGVLPSGRSIGFLRTNNFAGFSFDFEQLKDIQVFLRPQWPGPRIPRLRIGVSPTEVPR